VIELKPSNVENHNPNVGFEFPENKIEQAALEIYDGLIEYMKSFYTNNIDQATVNDCKLLLNEMIKTVEYSDLDQFSDDFEYETRLSK
jgi:hypothetical protein